MLGPGKGCVAGTFSEVSCFRKYPYSVIRGGTFSWNAEFKLKIIFFKKILQSFSSSICFLMPSLLLKSSVS